MPVHSDGIKFDRDDNCVSTRRTKCKVTKGTLQVHFVSLDIEDTGLPGRSARFINRLQVLCRNLLANIRQLPQYRVSRFGKCRKHMSS